MAGQGNKIYCAVFGCLNSSRTHPEISFFTLPSNSERRHRWLQLIHRDDLKNKPNFVSYRVCEKHFNAEYIQKSAKRMRLKRNALPLLMLPNSANTVPVDSRKDDKQTQTEQFTDENSTQTENAAKEKHTQTSEALSSNTPRIRKLKVELLQCRKKIKLIEKRKGTLKDQKRTFHRLCDTFLTDELALLIKAQSKLKHHGKGNRYDKDYITYCINLHDISPQAYRFLQSALCLPCPSTLYKQIKHSKETEREREAVAPAPGADE